MWVILVVIIAVAALIMAFRLAVAARRPPGLAGHEPPEALAPRVRDPAETAVDGPSDHPIAPPDDLR